MPRKKRKSPIVLLDQDALKYCFKEGYKIYPVTKDNVTYHVEMTLGHQKATLAEAYSMTSIHKGIADTYLRIYNKRKTK